jgi:hypothetical protein
MDLYITNNPLVLKTAASNKISDRLIYIEAVFLNVLTEVRDLVHKGRRLLTHPLSGSVKPNETPYKSVLVSGHCGETDEQSVRIIEEGIIAVRKFPPRDIPEHCLPDLQAVDLSLIRSALGRE